MRRATGARVHAEDVSLTTREGPVYTGVGFTARPGTLTVFQADSGGGRSALLLTLTGRMRPTRGLLHVDGHTLPRQARKVRRISALGLMNDVNALDERLRVREHLSEARLLRLRPAARSVTDEAMEAVGLADLDRSTLVKELAMTQRRRLGLALGLVYEPRLLAVDDVDGGLGTEHRASLWRTLKDLAEEGLTVIATCADAHGLDAVADRDTQGPLPIRQGGEACLDRGDGKEDDAVVGVSALLGPAEERAKRGRRKGGAHRAQD
ncbi:ATP-binding cassette domain-containing protein [Nocardiopsis sp. MG754419]|uniref:ATP-binding cassette domain-containing protein n=1 Tax=Nocardiopsis sp. MG754419 TaxID=2259865 RepID=UPI001BAB66F9|nr:ATP-binding cassette domain-containing protein [Nocardiopsis sp. MG754419]MBR8743629.1 ABC transporter [Nocardiopsis sp. MG754419]